MECLEYHIALGVLARYSITLLHCLLPEEILDINLWLESVFGSQQN